MEKFNKVIFLLIIFALIFYCFTFILPFAEVKYSNGTQVATFYFWGFERHIPSTPGPDLSFFPTYASDMVNILSNMPAGESFDYLKLVSIGFVFLSLSMVLFIFSMVSALIALYYFINKKIKKCKSWIFTSGVSSVSGLIVYFIIMSWIIFDYMGVTMVGIASPSGVGTISGLSIHTIPGISSSWSIGVYVFFIGGLFSLAIVFRDYAIKINMINNVKNVAS